MGSKMIRLALISLALLAVISFVACTSAQSARSTTPTEKPATPNIPVVSKPAPTTQQAAVTPGNQENKVYGTGTTDVSTDAKLTFGTGGKIEKLNTKRGDRATKGMVLAKLETSTLELAVLQAKTALSQAQLAQTQAEASVAVAQFAVDKIKDVNNIEDQIMEIQTRIDVAQVRVADTSSNNSASYWTDVVRNAQRDLDQKKRELAALLGKPEYAGVVTYDILSQKYDRWVVDDARTKQLQVEAAELSVVQATNSIEYAKKALDMAEKQLKDATITAPFDGIIATLDVKEGDIVAAPAQNQKPIIYLIDPTTLELNISVNELDVPKVKIGQKTVIKLDAFPDVKLGGKVTAISPVPIGQSGVVDYEVTIDFAVPPTIEIRVGMNATAEIAVE